MTAAPWSGPNRHRVGTRLRILFLDQNARSSALSHDHVLTLARRFGDFGGKPVSSPGNSLDVLAPGGLAPSAFLNTEILTARLASSTKVSGHTSYLDQVFFEHTAAVFEEYDQGVQRLGC